MKKQSQKTAWQAVAREWKAAAAHESEAGNRSRAETFQRAGDNAVKKANTAK